MEIRQQHGSTALAADLCLPPHLVNYVTLAGKSFEMTPTGLTMQQRNSIAVAQAKGWQSRAALGLMILLGTNIAGMVERSAYPSPTSTSADLFAGLSLPASLVPSNTTRRYCDPPNMTIIDLYEIYDSQEVESGELDYDFSQMEEMDFQVELSRSQEEAHWRWQALLWGSLVAPIPASLLATLLGPGRVFGFCVLTSGVLGLLVPSEGLAVQATVVSIQGVIHGCIQPCALLLTITSAPDEKKAMFLALLSGFRIGFGLAELIPAHLRPFTTCILAVTWFATWVLMLDTPRLPSAKHPIPWRKMIRSRVVWMSAAAVFGTELLQATTAYTLRQYLDFVYYFTNRYLLALPHFFTFLFAVLCACVGHLIEKRGLVSRTTTRRIFVYISHFIPAGVLFVSGFVGCEEVAPFACFALCTLLGGAAYAGAFASTLDVAPNFSAVVVALVCTCGAAARLIPVLLTALVFDGLMPGSWRLVMSLNALVALMTAIFFMLRGSSRPPSWNYPDMPHSPKIPGRVTFETCLLRVIAVQETEKFTRARACSTSGPRKIGRVLPLKRASIS